MARIEELFQCTVCGKCPIGAFFFGEPFCSDCLVEVIKDMKGSTENKGGYCQDFGGFPANEDCVKCGKCEKVD